MKKKLIIFLILLIGMAGLVACQDAEEDLEREPENMEEDAAIEEDAATEDVEREGEISVDLPSLHEVYQDYFPIGTAVTPAMLIVRGELITDQFNSITAENEMKPASVQPRQGQFDFNNADTLVQFAKENNLLVRGHTLVWHDQTPSWFFVDQDNNDVTREVLLERMKAHIDEVVGRYQGQVYTWDVVNEVVSDEGSHILRDSRWLEIIGEDYIEKAFQYAHEADPDALLFYNDYNLVQYGKRSKALRLVESLLDKGVPIHGVGIQGHWDVYGPSIEEIEETIQAFAELGLQIHITELDMSFYRWQDHNQSYDEPPAHLLEAQAVRYGQIFELFRTYQDVITNVTLWGVTDERSWLNYTPVQGRDNWPLLFDSSGQPKPGFESVVDF